MKFKGFLIIVILVVLAVAASFFAYKRGFSEAARQSESFLGCVVAGNKVTMADPPECRDEAGLHKAPKQ